MFTQQMGRLMRKVLVLAVLLASLTIVNIDSGLRKVAAQTTCCETCGAYVNDCLNTCLTWQCYYACFPKYDICRSQCNPPCS
jgi:hypothetical protein